MANTKSAEKRTRQSENRRQRNRQHRTRMRSAVKNLRAAVASGDADAARELLPQTISIVNHTAQRGVVHRNLAARTTSRLTKAVAALGQ
jgi:small subunit ribosomal protein S20